MKTTLVLMMLMVAGVAVFGGCAADKHAATDEPNGSPAVRTGHIATGSSAPVAGQPVFDSPDGAVAALREASMKGDLPGVAMVLGLHPDDIADTDAKDSTEDLKLCANGLAEYVNIVMNDEAHARVFMSRKNYPFPVPIVRGADGRWFFDSAGGKEEMLSRFIGENELSTIGVCHAYVEAQKEYFSEDRDGDGVMEYAQRLGSSPAQRDGLYWRTAEGEDESPLGVLIAQAQMGGYDGDGKAVEDRAKSYYGYRFKVLTRQGKNAPGGAYDYVINGNMVAGFALVAYPAKWNYTGVMTFIVGPNGRVYQKNLGKETPEVVKGMTAFDPDESWAGVEKN